MSSSIPIPQRQHKSSSYGYHEKNGNNSSIASSSTSSSSSSTYQSSHDLANSPQSTPLRSAYLHERRPSLLSESISKTEHIVINVGQPNAPRLISCVKASQGFLWNPDIFLPSHAGHDHGDLESRQEPVQEIILTDEEIKNMFPQ